MDTIQLLKRLKYAVEKLSSELDQSIAREKNLEDALNQSFPYSLYKQLRPDVVESLGEDEKALINHFLKYGIKNDIPFKETLEKYINLEEKNRSMEKKSEEKHKVLEERHREMEEALHMSFPYQLYKKLRPDVAKAIGDDDQALIKHYLKHGAKDNVPIQETLNNLSVVSIADSLAASYARDIYELEKPHAQHEAAESTLKFSKTSRTKTSIDTNERHEFARRFSLTHLKSNSVCTWIPKNSCSNLRYSIAIANGAISNISDLSWIHQNNRSFSASNKELLSAKYCFVLLRNPFKRLLSYYLDKICHNDNSQEDRSCELAHKVFNSSDETSFENFVNTIAEKPSLINDDIHTRKQSDFLVYSRYDDYLSLENYKASAEKIHQKIGLELFDVRDNNSIFTTKSKQESDQFTPYSSAIQNRRLLDDGIKPISENMYTLDMLRKVANIYFVDILLYTRTISDAHSELGEWIERLKTV